MNRAELRRWLHFAGGALGLIAIAYVAQRLFNYAGQIDASRLRGYDWLALAGLSVLYGASNVLLALAWVRVLAVLGAQARPAWAIHVYGVSQLAKYVPGNVFQFAGRQVLGMGLGVGARPLAKSTLWELALIAVAGAVFSLLALPLIWPGLMPEVAALGFAGAVLAVAYGLRRSLSRHMAVAWCLQLAFLFVSGGVFVAVMALVVPAHYVLPSMPSMAGAYVAAWLAGLVTPGAPAGVGVREAVLLFALGSAVAPGDLLLAVLLGRVITVAGDLLFFLSSLKFKVSPVG